MGCSNDRGGHIETAIASKQISTGFEDLRTDQVLNAIFRYAIVHSPLSPTQFDAISTVLHISVPSQFRDSLVQTSVLNLIVAGILLSKGPNQTKATVLFEAFDTSASGQLTEIRVKELLTVLFQVTSTVLQSLYRDLNDQEKQYFDRLERCVPSASLEAKLILLPQASVLSKPVFVTRLSEYKSGQLLRLSGLRSYLHAQTPLISPQ